jgi:hypothetical protein
MSAFGGSQMPLLIKGRATATVDVASLFDGAGATSSVTVAGAALGDPVLVGFGVDLVDMTVTAYVSAANTVEIRVQNESGSTADLASTTVTVFVIDQNSGLSNPF